jgi:hypothetical protein
LRHSPGKIVERLGLDPASGYRVVGSNDERRRPVADNDLVLRIPHSLGAAEARRRIAGGVETAKAQYGQFLQGADLRWDEDRLNFAVTALAQTIQGTVDVKDDHVELRAQLPLVIRLLAKRFLPIVQDTGQKLLK